MEDDPVVESVLAVSTRWPPLALKKESGCSRLSKKELSTVWALRLRCTAR